MNVWNQSIKMSNKLILMNVWNQSINQKKNQKIYNNWMLMLILMNFLELINIIINSANLFLFD
jgi:hypothetical protein